MVAKLDYTQLVVDKHYENIKNKLIEHLKSDSEEYEDQDNLLTQFQSLRAAKTVILNASRQPTLPRHNLFRDNGGDSKFPPLRGSSAGDLDHNSEKDLENGLKAILDGKDASDRGSSSNGVVGSSKPN